MTPRPLSAATVTKRLVLMRELLEDLEEIGPVDADRLETDRIVRRALERILAQLVEIATDINQHVATAGGAMPSEDYRGSFDAAARVGVLPADLAHRLKPSVGLRNVLVHEYVNVDLAIVAAAIPHALRDYRAYVGAIAAWVSAQMGLT